MAEQSTETKVMSLQEEVSKLFEGSEMTDEMQEKVGTILEAVITDQVAQKLEESKVELQEQFDKDLEEQMQALEESMSQFLDFAVNEWREENKLAIETGIRADLTEAFMADMRTVFESHDIDMPQEKVDALAESQQKLAESEANLTSAIKESTELKASIDGFKRDKVLTGLAEGLTDTQVEKFGQLTEDLAFDDKFENKATTIRETFFKPEPAEETQETVVTESTVPSTKAHPMAKYLSALG